ncbi:MAG: hypothetical protein ABS81_05070 [Pseudonocardia sp. SCN 72-86]|nr:MAG: hypothetical protein ABS81_05070 [Pseudonocardia sp. SCN 72-86]
MTAKAVAVSSPVVGRRRLAVALRRHRLAAGHTIDDVAQHLDCSPAKVSRIETGAVKVSSVDLRAILDLYQVGDAERDSMLALVRQARQRGWWTEFTDVVPPGSATFYGLEDGASVIRQHTTSLVPGLLQTRDYARALIKSGAPVDPGLAERRLALRMRRQQLLTRPDRPRLDVVLDEAVLHRQIGGPAVLAAQLEHLIYATADPATTVQVVEFAGGAHPAAGASFTVFGFADHPAPQSAALEDLEDASPVVFREQLDANSFLDTPDDVALYIAAWNAARAQAADPHRSIELIAARIASLRSQVAMGSAH